MVTRSSYIVALGSNRRGRHGAPAAELRAALRLIEAVRSSPIITSAPLGPSARRFANAAALVETDEAPPELLARLKGVETAFGRRGARRWGARVLDLDIVLWSAGRWRSRRLTVPHAAFRERAFVLAPVATLAPCWRDPMTGLTMRQLARRLTARRPAPTSRGVGL